MPSLDTQAIIVALEDANTAIHLVRFNHTQFCLPLADAKLVRVSQCIKDQIAEIEKRQWAEAGLVDAAVGGAA
jgi:hypothetical protein